MSAVFNVFLYTNGNISITTTIYTKQHHISAIFHVCCLVCIPIYQWGIFLLPLLSWCSDSQHPNARAWNTLAANSSDCVPHVQMRIYSNNPPPILPSSLAKLSAAIRLSFWHRGGTIRYSIDGHPTSCRLGVMGTIRCSIDISSAFSSYFLQIRQLWF